MASRYADNQRSRFDDRRGGRSAPRREYRDRRDDRYDDRHDDRHDDRRNRDSYAPSRRRSRSPVRRNDRDRRERSRERYDDRYRRDRTYDDRERDSFRRDDRDNRDRDRDRDTRRGSGTGDIRRSRSPREDRSKREVDKPKDDPKAAQEAKRAKLAAWKKEQEAKKKAQVQSPAVTAPATPTTPATPTSELNPNIPAVENLRTEKPAQPSKGVSKADNSVKQKTVQGNLASLSTASIRSSAAGAAALKPHGNISSFGLKSKISKEIKEEKNALLDDEDNIGRRKLRHLPDLPDGPSPPPVTDDVMSDIASDDDEHVQAQLQKRREAAATANEDTPMNDAPADEHSGTSVQVDEEEEIDPLDMFMAALNKDSANVAPKTQPQGEAMFADDIEPDMQAVEDEDLLAMTSVRKKKKDIPVVDHTKINYPEFRKDFYNEPQEIRDMTPEEVADLRLELDGTKVKPMDGTPRPVVKWAQMGLLQQTIDVFGELGYSKPTPIQSQAIPIALAGRDLFGVAKTGSGKTLAFGIPIIRHILDQPPLKSSDGPIVLIMAPTRELVVQIQNELKPFLAASSIKIACAYGGPPISEHIAMIKRGGFSALVATPGRLIDLLQSNSGRILNFRRTTYVVLDEADRMFDQGFEPQIKKILASIRPDRQTVLFSATQPKQMMPVFRKFITNPVEVNIGGRSVVAPEITQVIKVVTAPFVTEKLKQLLLHLGNLFQSGSDDDVRALVFVERQETAEDLLSKLLKRSYSCDAIHGGRDQQDRSDAISDFKKGALPILIATSVAARGLDVPQVRLVINYDCPSHLEDYVHRCGRTGRAGNTGTAITLIEQPGQERFAIHVVKALKDSNQPVPDDLKNMANVFEEKVKAGTEKWGSGGFGGKGLDKLDQARAIEKRREKRAHKGDFGDESDSEPEDAQELPAIVSSTDANPAAADSPAAGDKDEPRWKSILKGGFVVNKTERPAANEKLSNVDRSKAAAAAINARLGQKGRIHHGQPIDNKGPDAGAFHSTVEINGFPQKARWAVTNRTNVAKILDSTGTSITTKGTYYAPGVTPGEDDLPPLYILVEGDTENVVHAAMSELLRLLREGTMAAQDEPTTRGPTGRYNVV